MTSNHNHNEHTIISISRVVLNDTKDKAFFTIYKGGCLPYLDKILAKKENEKWHFQEIIKEKYD